MKLPRRQFLHLAAGAAVLPAVSRIARAQSYPSRPVRLIVASAAGGGSDILARLMGQWLSERLGQPFIIENRPGAGGNIGTEAVVHAPADGYTLLICAATNTINATLYDKLNFNFIRDITPVTGLMRVPLALEVNLSVPARTVPQFVAYAKANPNKINMASSGNGTPLHVAGELFNMMTGTQMVHVPYRGDAPALTDLLGAQVQVMFASMPASIEYIRAGKLRALAVTTASRSEALFGVAAPKGVPAEIIEKLNKEINTALANPKIKARLADLGGAVFPNSPAEFGNFIAAETEKWGKVIRAANIKPE